ncbi:hypothetical protein SMICM17S_01642 [Streptomyces microflavus]
MGVTEAAQVPQQRGEQLLDAAVRYAEERHWDVFPGTWLEAVEGRELCSCGEAACPLPGAHADRPDWAGQATGSGAAARRMWSKQPRASVLLPTGRTFDALDVPESAGFLALARMERMDLTLGPVTCTPDRRMLFFVLPGAAAKASELGARSADRQRSTSWAAARATTSPPRPPGSAAAEPCSGPASPPTPTGGCPMWTS